ncbi:hypothetical protein [Flavobacterium sp.]|uniref:hypothetical protein n=1 Tax=Flavobacterium sp. TaxID=239 RepID=UPI003D0DA1A7
MAIYKTAKNLKIKISNVYTCYSKAFYETSEKIEIVATKENLTLYSGNKIQIRGNKS